MSRKKKRIPTRQGEGLTQNPFGALSGLGNLPAGPERPSGSPQNEIPENPARGPKHAKRGRVDIVRQTAHRGGKAVTVVTNFQGIGLPEKEALARTMQKACGTGGTVKNGQIEIQGDKREEVKRILIAAGFQPVMAGG